MLTYVFTKTWKLAIAAASVSENELKKIVGSMLERISLKKLYISESSEIRELHDETINFWMKKWQKIFHAFSKSIYMTMQPVDILNNRYTKQTSAWKTFNIRQKLGLFGLHSYVNISKVEIFHVLRPRHLRHDKVALLILIQGDVLSVTELEIDCKG